MKKPLYNPASQAPYIYLIDSAKSWKKFAAFYKKYNSSEDSMLKYKFRGSVKKAAEGLLSNFMKVYDKNASVIRYNWNITRTLIQAFNEGCYNNTYHIIDKLRANGFLVDKSVSVGNINGKQLLSLELTINAEVVHFEENPNPFASRIDVDNSYYLVYNSVENICKDSIQKNSRTEVTSFTELFSSIILNEPL